MRAYKQIKGDGLGIVGSCNGYRSVHLTQLSDVLVMQLLCSGVHNVRAIWHPYTRLWHPCRSC